MSLRIILNSTFFLLICSSLLFADDGQIIDRKSLDISIENENINKENYQNMHYLSEVKAEELTYLSDGLKVKAYLVTPKEEGSYPCIIYNRGGNREFGSLSPKKVRYIFARIASWGYVVIGSQYRGNGGGEGNEQFGGQDVNDVLNLIPALNEVENADTSRIGMFGWSRGGMMTYLALSRTNRIKTAVVGGGLSDLFKMKNSRPEMEDVYRELIPQYDFNKDSVLAERSVIRWPEKICKTTPILLFHGTADWRVIPEMALDLASAFLKVQQPFRLVLFEGADHGINEFNDETYRITRDWFNLYLRDKSDLPNLDPHGR